MIDIRSLFIDFFKNKNHKHFRYDSILPMHDPTLLFINSGMAPLKNYFTGNSKPPYKNLVSCQPCLRVGGKHNDLSEVGYSKRHLTFFQMLGNFSFGEITPHGAINFALEFLIDILKLDLCKLYITMHPEDTDTIQIWDTKPEFSNRIFQLNENSWAAGDFGPRGYCTEFFYDLGPQYEGNLPGNGETGERYIEIWNLVFMHEYITKNNTLPLEKKCIDTGLGFERIEAVVTYQSPDIFKSTVLKTLLELLPIDNPHARIIVDHLRTIIFMLADGLKPGPNTEEYILRRLIRRVYRQLSFFKGDPINIITPIINKSIELDGKYYLHLNKLVNVLDTFEKEFNQFKQNWIFGISILEKEIKKSTSQIFSGKTAFTLHDTYGFPLDLTEEILAEKNFQVDLTEYNFYMDQQKILSNKLAHKELVIFQGIENLPETTFIYDQIAIDTKIIALYDLNGRQVTELKSGYIVTQETNFYILGGGQEPDHGFINSSIIEKGLKINGIILHYVEGNFKLHDNVSIQIDAERRSQLKVHHTTVHLINAALKKIDQTIKGVSGNVGLEKIKFDFEYQDIEPKVDQIEQIINNWIYKDLEVQYEYMPYKKALDLGALSTGEKYPDQVRVVSIENISKELCCGTHVRRLTEICNFKIIEYRSTGKNIKRITGIAGVAMMNYFKTYKDKLKMLEQISGKQISEIENMFNQDNPSNYKLMTGQYIDYQILIGICQNFKSNEFLNLVKKQKQDINLFINTIKDKSSLICISKICNAQNLLIAIVGQENFTGGGNEYLAQCSINKQTFIEWINKECKNLTL